MKKLSTLLICACMLVSCSNTETTEVIEDYGKISVSEESYEIDSCTFDYKLYIGCERNDFEGILKKDSEVICEYSASGFVGNYPEKVVNLFDDVYYIENREVENYETLFYIAKDGTMYPDFVQADEQEKQEQLEYVSEFLRENITEQEVADIFDKCGYDDTYILDIYNYTDSEEQTSGRDYGKISVGNNSYDIDGCTFDYTSYIGCSRNDFEGVLKKYDETICEYSASGFVGNYPEKVVYLFDDVYYIENREVEGHETLYYIAKGGKMYPDFTERDEKLKAEQAEYISEFLRENLTEQQISDIFSYCGYDDTYILDIYGYSGKD